MFEKWKEIMRNFSKKVGLNMGKAIAEGSCHFVLNDDLNVIIGFNGHMNSFIWCSPIGQIPKENNAEILHFLLCANSITNKLTIALDLDENEVYVNYRYPIRFTNDDIFEKKFEMFIMEVIRWKNIMKLLAKGQIPEIGAIIEAEENENENDNEEEEKEEEKEKVEDKTEEKTKEAPKESPKEDRSRRRSILTRKGTLTLVEPPKDLPKKINEAESSEEEEERQKIVENEDEDEKDLSNLQSDILKIFDVKDLKNLKKLKKIGSSPTSEIFKVQDKKKKIYTLKVVNASTSGDNGYARNREFMKNYEILNEACHQNIVTVYGICFGDATHPISLLLEYCPSTLENDVSSLNKVQKVAVIYEVARTMKHVHSLNVIHRNLKPSNILLSAKKRVKLCDFGVSSMIDNDNPDESRTCKPGTTEFMAPEVLSGSTHYGQKIDVYAFGIVMFYILTGGKMPKITPQQIIEKQKAKIPDTFNQLSKELVEKCFEFDPKNRPTFSEIVETIEKNYFKLIDGVSYEDVAEELVKQ